MAAGSLLALFDDIATLLDDVATMTKIAARKTAGVLGDDLALNAEQVSGVRAERELPVVWAVAKGSLLNKAILVPAALLISAIMPALITPLLMIGGAYLCFEGAEKLLHKFFHHAHDEEDEHQQKLALLAEEQSDLVAFEQEKIKGAIRTDFVLSAEIIVIALGTLQQVALPGRIAALIAVAIVMTIGVYGLVALIVKLDDMGLWLLRRPGTSLLTRLQHLKGRFLLWLAPALMKLLTILGTVAMFLVGGGILLHGLPFAHHLLEQPQHWSAGYPLASLLATTMELALTALVGILAGCLLVALMTLINRFRPRSAGNGVK